MKHKEMQKKTKIDKIKESIERGDYKLSSVEIAQAIVESLGSKPLEVLHAAGG